MSKTKKKSREKEVADDGEPFIVDDGHLFLACCGCQLVHHFVFDRLILKKGKKLLVEPIDFPIVIRPFRDEDATKFQRQKKRSKKK